MFSYKSREFIGVPIFVSVALAACVSSAAPLHPDSIQVLTGEGGASTSSPYQDDVYLNRIGFGDTLYTYTENMVAIDQFEVLEGRDNINAEWGDLDGAEDGDDNPFAKAGYDPSLQETVDPMIQDLSLKQVFNANSLTEMSDGEGGDGFWFRASFTHSLVDDIFGIDTQPEIVLFERGLNDEFDIRLITGGSFYDPITSDWLTTDSRDFSRTGIYVDTVEIGGPQELGVGGFDLDEFGVAEGERVYGLEIRTNGNSGPDLNGLFMTAESVDLMGPGLTPVPVQSSTLFLGLSALGSFVSWSWFGRREERRKGRKAA